MVQWVDFFPFNIESGPTFLWFYFFFGSVGLALLFVIKDQFARFVDRKLAESSSAPSGSGRKLRVGSLPRAEDAYAIAHLQGREEAVANTLVSEAVAAGWLRPSETAPSTFSCSEEGPPAHGAAAFHKTLGREVRVTGSVTAAKVVTLARQEATEVARTLSDELGAAGFLRSDQDMAKIRLVVGLGGALLLGVGIVRLLRAMALGRPATYLILEMVAFTVALSWLRRVSTCRP